MVVRARSVSPVALLAPAVSRVWRRAGSLEVVPVTDPGRWVDRRLSDGEDLAVELMAGNGLRRHRRNEIQRISAKQPAAGLWRLTGGIVALWWLCGGLVACGSSPCEDLPETLIPICEAMEGE